MGQRRRPLPDRSRPVVAGDPAGGSRRWRSGSPPWIPCL